MRWVKPALSRERWRDLWDTVGRIFVVMGTITAANWFFEQPSIRGTITPFTDARTTARVITTAAVSTATPFVIVQPTLVPTRALPVVAQLSAPPLTPTPVLEQEAATPAQRVALFYRLLDQSDFDSLPQLMSSDYRKQIPDPSSLKSRLDPGHLVIRRNETFMQSSKVAGVLVDVAELFSTPRPFTNRYVGVWWLVNSSVGWLLDKPDLELQEI